MQKWEYLIVKQVPCDLYVNGNKHTSYDFDSPKFFAYIKRLGEEGWELVNFTEGGLCVRTWAFKRPKE